MPSPETIQLTTLRRGTLAFTAQSLGEGPVVLLLHGFPDTLHSWRYQLPEIAAAGYRAVAVAMRGYEPGSQPADGDYAQDTLAGDVIAFLDCLGAQRAHLIGHDWGAVVAYAAARDYPGRFASLTTMAVPHAGRFISEIYRHPRQLRLSWYMAFFQLRGIAEAVVRRHDFAFLRRLWRNWSPGWQFSEEDFRPVAEAFSQPGVLHSALAYYRAALSPGALPVTRAARASSRWRIDVPTLAITGAGDGCIAPEVFRQLMYPGDFPAGLRVETIPAAGHFAHVEQPDKANSLLRDWLHDNSDR